MNELKSEPCDWLLKDFKAVREQRSRHDGMIASLRRYTDAINGTSRKCQPHLLPDEQCHSLYLIEAAGGGPPDNAVQLAMVMDCCSGRLSSSDLRRIWTQAVGKLNDIAHEYNQRGW